MPNKMRTQPVVNRHMATPMRTPNQLAQTFEQRASEAANGTVCKKEKSKELRKKSLQTQRDLLR